jgi:para-nitrobenzyl esterase
VVTDDQFSCNALRTDQALLAQQVPVYAYEFDDQNAPPFIDTTNVSIPLGAYHGSETGYLFINPFERLDSQQHKLADQMIMYWAHFAASGNPNVWGQTYWPEFNTASGNLLSLAPNDNHVINSFAADHQCAFWLNIDGGLF